MSAVPQLSRGTLSRTERERLLREAAEATARGSKSFSFATRFFPTDLAQAAHAVYWFCRTTDDLVDECPEPELAAANLAAWSVALEHGLAGRDPGDPVLRLFCETVALHGIPHAYPRELIEGVRMDLTQSRYRSFDDLHVFCYRVASVVGLMMMHVIGYRGEPSQQAIDLGVAMQLTNILRDVGEDWRRGRIYLPQEELERFGYSESDLAAGVRNENFLRLIRFQIQRARRYYASAEPGIPALDERGRFSVEIASRVYAGILDVIEENDFDVFSRRAVVPRRRKYWITMRSLARPAMRRSVRRIAFWQT